MLALWTFVKGISLRFWAYVAIFFAALAALAKVFSAGRNAERQATNQQNLETKDAQLEAAVNRPNTDAELDRKLRDGTF